MTQTSTARSFATKDIREAIADLYDIAAQQQKQIEHLRDVIHRLRKYDQMQRVLRK